jgi:maltose/moltooligosaccharide transporter
VPDNVTYSFYFGAFVLISSILWTIFSTSEYPPEELTNDANVQEKQKFYIPPVMIQLLLVMF